MHLDGEQHTRKEIRSAVRVRSSLFQISVDKPNTPNLRSLWLATGAVLHRPETIKSSYGDRPQEAGGPWRPARNGAGRVPPSLPRGPEGIRHDGTPAEGEGRQQGLEASPVRRSTFSAASPTIGAARPFTEEEGRGQRPPPDRDRARPAEDKRPLGHAPRRRNLPRAARSNGLTIASGCILTPLRWRRCTIFYRRPN